MGLTMTVDGIGRGIRRSSAGGSNGGAMPWGAVETGGSPGHGSADRETGGTP